MVCMSHQALQGLHTCTLKKKFCRPARGPRILGRYSERVKSILESPSAIAHNSLLC